MQLKLSATSSSWESSISKVALAAGFLAVAAAVLAGCGGAINTVRSAAGEDEAAASPATSGGNKGSRLCVTNETGGNFDVTFEKADTSAGGVITPGQSACGEGTSFMGNDVAGNIKFFEGTNPMSFWASNPWAGSPRARLSTNGPGWSTDCSVGDSDATSGENKADRCFVNSQGATAAHQMELWRHGDTNWKEFEVIIRYGN